MAKALPSTSASGPFVADIPASVLPVVRLDVRPATGRSTIYEVGDGGFLVGSVPGCDLRLPGINLAPVICLVARHAGGASLRKLAPAQPIQVNGKTVSATYLIDGDRIRLGSVEIVVSIAVPVGIPGTPPAAPVPTRLPDHRVRDLEARERRLAEQQQQLQADQAHWERHRALLAQVEQRAQQLDHLQQHLEQQQRQLLAREQELAAQDSDTNPSQAGLQAVRQELEQIRQRLYQRYHERKERQARKEQKLHKAAQRFLKRKKQLEEDTARLAQEKNEHELRKAEVEAGLEQMQRERSLLDEQHRLVAGKQQDVLRQLCERHDEMEAREAKIAEDQAALEKGQKQHQADLLRLDRIQATLDQRQKQLQNQALDIDHRFEQLQRDSRELEEQATQLDDWHKRLTGETERLAAQQQTQEASVSQLDQRAAALESQQAMLATLRTRLERMREEMRQQEQALGDQRTLQEASENDLRERVAENQRLRVDLDNDRQLFEEERRRFEERQATLDAAVAQLRQVQEQCERDQAAFQQRQEQCDAITHEQTEQAAVLLARGSQLEEVQNRLGAERQALRERETTLGQAEHNLAALQEQLRRRADVLNERQRLLEEREQKIKEELAGVEGLSRSQVLEYQTRGADLERLNLELNARSEELARHTEEVLQREAALRAQREGLEEAEGALAGQRQALNAERIAWEVDRQSAAETAARIRAEIEAAQAEAAELGKQLPDLEARADSAVERLLRGREQLREHLAEIHTYARQSRDDLETARQQVQDESERLRQQEQALNVARDEHRLAVAAFRQQLIEWQAAVGEMKQTLQQGESQLDRRQAEVNEQAQRLATTTAQLAQQAEELQQQERKVAEKRTEMDRHLTDMREWYRRKLRELAGVDLPPPELGDGEPDAEGMVVPLPRQPGEPPVEQAGADGPAPEHSILSLTEEVEPGDRQLGELLRSLELVDADTLTALLLEARRQRRSLRQLLLDEGYLTLFQMALIEAGNLDGLVLGPVRVIDRLPATPREAVFRVFDPRSNREAVLRHLAETEMHDAVRPDEFRQRFAAAAALQHTHLVKTWEVLEIAGRPAVLQEWIEGVPSTEWPALAAAPGVWFRLLSQAGLALMTAHSAGLVHGHLHPSSFVFAGEGVLKLCGLGEPRWLAMYPVSEEEEPAPAGDLTALGVIAASWAALAATAAPRKGAKNKQQMPGELQFVLTRLNADRPEDRFASAAALLEALDQASAQVPPNATAWERFVKQIHDQSADRKLRRTG